MYALVFERGWSRRLIAVCLAVAGSYGPVLNNGTTAADDVRNVLCGRYTVTVTLSPSDATPFQVAGQLCTRFVDRRNGFTVQVLIPGATYNHTYWDFPVGVGLYSYARSLAAGGLPTFAYDRVGTGASSHPVSSKLTVDTGAYVAHQLVQGLRGGAVTGTAWGRVVTVGHSLGSQTAWAEAIAYQDVDGLVITGQTHFESTLFRSIGGFIHPANQDPSPFLQSLHLDNGYLTTVPGDRGTPILYNAANADPIVIDADEASKDAVPVSELQTGAALITSPTATLAIHAPVLLVIGAKDAIFCDASGADPAHSCASSQSVYQMERPFYAPGVCLATVAVPNAGHSVSLHRDAGLVDLAARTWITAVVGQNGVGGGACVEGVLSV
jgi:pimeloyl-ACP methyl ester carboxylesterase